MPCTQNVPIIFGCKDGSFIYPDGTHIGPGGAVLEKPGDSGCSCAFVDRLAAFQVSRMHAAGKDKKTIEKEIEKKVAAAVPACGWMRTSRRGV